MNTKNLPLIEVTETELSFAERLKLQVEHSPASETKHGQEEKKQVENDPWAINYYR